MDDNTPVSLVTFFRTYFSLYITKYRNIFGTDIHARCGLPIVYNTKYLLPETFIGSEIYCILDTVIDYHHNVQCIVYVVIIVCISIH